jgi:hypothetical protein
MKRALQVVVWGLVALLGAVAYAVLATCRGEPLNAAWILAAAGCTGAIGYRFYSKWIAARILALTNIFQFLDSKSLDLTGGGMPYQRLRADIKIQAGVAKTENLLLESRAMKVTAHGQVNLVDETVDLDVAVKPLQTLDTLVAKIPIAGWLLGGKQQSLLVAYYKVTGPLGDPEIAPQPLQNLGRNLFGIFRRLLEIPESILGPFGELPPQEVKPEPNRSGRR